MRILLGLVLGCVVGCSSEPPGPGATSSSSNSSGGMVSACAPGEGLLEDGSCRAAGLPPDTPDPGPNGSIEVGVPQDDCGHGFAPDGDGGCEPILPRAD